MPFQPSDFCSTGGFTERGIKEAQGFMTEFVVEQAHYLIPVPRALRQVAVLIEPLTIAKKPWRNSDRCSSASRGLGPQMVGCGSGRRRPTELGGCGPFTSGGGSRITADQTTGAEVLIWESSGDASL